MSRLDRSLSFMAVDGFTISISGIKGTTHFSLSYSAVRRIKCLFVFILGLFGLLLVLLSLFANDASSSEKARELALQKAMLLKEKLKQSRDSHASLNDNLNQKQQDLRFFSEKISDIESALALSNVELDLKSRVGLVGLNVAARHQILQRIPNGRPVKNGHLSSRYGKRLHPVKKIRAMHHGIDYAVKSGTPIYATADGIVETARKSNMGSGNFLKITHSFGFTSSYSHLQGFEVIKGEYVRKGDLIGYTGNTGLSTGAHLHYEIRLVGRSLDPLPFVRWEMRNFESIFNKNKEIKWDYLVNKIESQIALALKLSSRKVPSSKDNSNWLVTSISTDR
ncbi:M23 family metallopeptidase [Vibrio caribbeanicus]|nr:M23 family metallopeptidase [Vibrio caribbeanicus]